ncbi:hypothetical protein P12x_003041 [Tundrisphaera lichenicola]|uniref:hypothetical protein n=1 Tax=Tundrisphaera lichenicola TaxID=2029860 RepID=UPI003EBC6F26
MPLPRLTTRRLMAIVAALALALGAVAWLDRRSRRFAELDRYHLERWLVHMNDASQAGQLLAEYHSRQARRHRRVAESPWLPLESERP